jgi:hypothetical protein
MKRRRSKTRDLSLFFLRKRKAGPQKKRKKEDKFSMKKEMEEYEG